MIIAVVLFFRHKESRVAAVADDDKDDDGFSFSPRAVAYGLLGVLALLSVALFAVNWHAQNRIVQIRVINASEKITDYRAKYKSIRGRNFVTTDGVKITLGEGDRIEMIEADR